MASSSSSMDKWPVLSQHPSIVRALSLFRILLHRNNLGISSLSIHAPPQQVETSSMALTQQQHQLMAHLSQLALSVDDGSQEGLERGMRYFSMFMHSMQHAVLRIVVKEVKQPIIYFAPSGNETPPMPVLTPLTTEEEREKRQTPVDDDKENESGDGDGDDDGDNADVEQQSTVDLDEHASSLLQLRNLPLTVTPTPTATATTPSQNKNIAHTPITPHAAASFASTSDRTPRYASHAPRHVRPPPPAPSSTTTPNPTPNPKLKLTPDPTPNATRNATPATPPTRDSDNTPSNSNSNSLFNGSGDASTHTPHDSPRVFVAARTLSDIPGSLLPPRKHLRAGLRVSKRTDRRCSNCHTTRTRQWLRGEKNVWLCHRCGQYWRKNGKDRPDQFFTRPVHNRAPRSLTPTDNSAVGVAKRASRRRKRSRKAAAADGEAAAGDLMEERGDVHGNTEEL